MAKGPDPVPIEINGNFATNFNGAGLASKLFRFLFISYHLSLLSQAIGTNPSLVFTQSSLRQTLADLKKTTTRQISEDFRIWLIAWCIKLNTLEGPLTYSHLRQCFLRHLCLYRLVSTTNFPNVLTQNNSVTDRCKPDLERQITEQKVKFASIMRFWNFLKLVFFLFIVLSLCTVPQFKINVCCALKQKTFWVM